MELAPVQPTRKIEVSAIPQSRSSFCMEEKVRGGLYKNTSSRNCEKQFNYQTGDYNDRIFVESFNLFKSGISKMISKVALIMVMWSASSHSYTNPMRVMTRHHARMMFSGIVEVWKISFIHYAGTCIISTFTRTSISAPVSFAKYRHESPRKWELLKSSK